MRKLRSATLNSATTQLKCVSPCRTNASTCRLPTKGPSVFAIRSTRSALMASIVTSLLTTVEASTSPTSHLARNTQSFPTRSAIATTSLLASLATCAKRGNVSSDQTRVRRGRTPTLAGRIAGVPLPRPGAPSGKCARRKDAQNLRLTVHRLLWLQRRVLASAAGQPWKRRV